MESFPLSPFQAQRPLRADTANKKRGRVRAKVVAISSCPAWRDLRGDDPSEGETAVDSVDLMRAFHEVLERVRQSAVLNMDADSMTTERMIDQIWHRLTMENAPLPLSHLLRGVRSERSVTCLFLALLELARTQGILLRQDNMGEILLKRKAGAAGLKCTI